MAKRRSSSGKRLAEYRRKRDFATSPEPAGERSPRRGSKRRRFCVQKHLASHLHYDLRLEHNGTMLSWAVPKGPSLDSGDKRLAMRVEDHPVDYCKFEGVIPEGYGAGIVMLWDRGTWRNQSDDIDEALARGELKFELSGVKLKGSWVLVRTGGGQGRQWLLIKHRDEWAGEVDVTTFAPLSVKTFGDFADIFAAAKRDEREKLNTRRGGEAGRMLADIVRRAEKIKTKTRRGVGRTVALKGRR